MNQSFHGQASFAGQQAKVMAMRVSIEKLHKKIEDARKATSFWGKAFKEMGLESTIASMKKLASVAGLISIFAKAFAENARQAGLWKLQNYETYGR